MVCEQAIPHPDNDPGIRLIEQARNFMCSFQDSDANRNSANRITDLRKEIHDLETRVTSIAPRSTWPFEPSGDFDVNLFRIFDHEIAVQIRKKKQDLWAAINDRYNAFGVNSLPAEFSDYCRTNSAPGHITGKGELSSLRYNVESYTLGSDAYVGYTNTIFDWVDTWERHKEPLESFLRNVNLWAPLPIGLGTQTTINESHIVHFQPLWELANPQMFRELRDKIIPTVDVLVLYTRESLATLGSNPQQSIQDVIDLQNQIFRNSGVFGRVRLVAAEQLHDPTEDIESFTRTTRIRDWINSSLSQDPYQIKQRRDFHNADVVSVWVQLNGMNSVGSAAQADLPPTVCQLTNSVRAENNFFHVILAAKAANRFHFAHEIGHNLGLSHDEEAGRPNDPPFEEGQGYILKALHPDKRTIMAYSTGCADYDGDGDKDWQDCQRIPNYSNPRIRFSGQATGREPKANAARVLKSTLRFVSRYR